MKTKHTNVGLSLLVIVTALTFGMGGSYAQAENLFFQKIIESKNFYGVDNAHYYQVHPEEHVQIGEIKLNQNEQLLFDHLHIQREDYKKDNGNPNYRYSGNNFYKGIIVLTVKYSEFDTPVTLYYNKAYNSLGQNTREKWSLLNGEAFVGGTFPLYGPADININVQPYALQLDSGGGRPYGTQYPKQNWRMSFKRTIASFLQPQTQLQALVLPKNTKNTRLIVESSEDLVNWAIDTPGPKTTTNRERFFRLRAVKE
jgi:hypothetical protein